MEPRLFPFWMAFAHAQSFSNTRKMEFLIDAVFTPGKELDVVMNEINAGSPVDFAFTGKESDGLIESLKNLPNYAFLAEELVNNHISVISVMEPDYPRQLKRNLGKNAPVLLYCKGNSDLLKLGSIAIVGSRNCSQAALLFADNIAKAGTEKKQVVVSGFAKGVDQQALNSTLAYHGQSIIVLPQGILTYRSNTYYQYIVKGDVLVMSSYHPRTPWEVGLAMDRNKIIYGLADEIYVAESDTKGGTWEGVHDGLRKGRKIFVRKPADGEVNANGLLISKGAIPIDDTGLLADITTDEPPHQKKIVSDELIVEMVISLLTEQKGKGLSSMEIIDILKLDRKPGSITAMLKKSSKLVSEKKGNTNLFRLAADVPVAGSLF